MVVGERFALHQSCPWAPVVTSMVVHHPLGIPQDRCHIHGGRNIRGLGLIGLAGEDKDLDSDSVLSEQSMQATPYSTTEIELPVFEPKLAH